VLQDPFLFLGTVKDNIRMNNEAISDEEVGATARFALADAFFRQLPRKYACIICSNTG
jgi:ATP-binding cassette, subfamily B, multidrug efflux pump